MKTYTRRLISLAAALALLITCVITGLVLPASADATNLVANGDFENGATGWTSATDIKEGVGKGGSWGLEMPVTNTSTLASNNHWYQGNICAALEVGETYVISLDYNITKGADTFVQFDVYNDAALKQWLTTKNVHTGVTDGWQTWTHEFTVGESLPNVAENVANGWTFEIRAVNYQVASQESMAYVDNVSITKKVEKVPATPSTEGSLFIEDFQYDNGGFKYGNNAAVVETEADGNKALVMDAKGSMLLGKTTAQIKAGKQYLFRFKYKNANGLKARMLTAFYNKADGGYQTNWFAVATTDTEWTYAQYSYIAAVDAESISLGLYLENSGNTADGAKVLIDDVELIEVNNKTNLIPGGDMNTKSSWFKTYYSKGSTLVADTVDASNQVLHQPAGKSDIWLQGFGMQQNKLYEVSFRYRGGKIVHWWSAQQAGLHQNIGSTAASETWAEYKAYVHTKGTKTAEYFMIRTDAGNGNAEVYIDDFCVREVAIAADATATVAVGGTAELKVTVKPEGAVIPKMTWASDNEAIATVADGVVTGVAEGTANITGTAGPLSVTVAVTVTAAADPAIVWTEDYEGSERVNSIKNWTAKGEIVTDPKNSANKVLKLTAAAATTYNGAGMGMEKGKVYALSLDYMGGTVKIGFNTSKGLIAPGDLTYAAATEWTTLTYYIVALDTLTNDGYMLHLNAPVDTYLDNITLKEIGTKGDIAATEDGLLPGADFEVTNPVPWKNILGAGATIVADPAAAGNQVLYFPAGYGKGAYWNHMNQGLQANTKYTLSADVYGDAIWLYLNGDKGIVDGKGWTKLAASGNAWTTVTHTFTTGESVSNGVYMLGFGVDINSTTGLYMDNVKITKYVEPAPEVPTNLVANGDFEQGATG